jgi:type IV secretory pathway TrbD component
MAKPIMHIRRGIAALLGLALWLVGAAPIPRGSVVGLPRRSLLVFGAP